MIVCTAIHAIATQASTGTSMPPGIRNGGWSVRTSRTRSRQTAIAPSKYTPNDARFDSTASCW